MFVRKGTILVVVMMGIVVMLLTIVPKVIYQEVLQMVPAIALPVKKRLVPLVKIPAQMGSIAIKKRGYVMTTVQTVWYGMDQPVAVPKEVIMDKLMDRTPVLQDQAMTALVLGRVTLRGVQVAQAMAEQVLVDQVEQVRQVAAVLGVHLPAVILVGEREVLERVLVARDRVLEAELVQAREPERIQALEAELELVRELMAQLRVLVD